MFDPTPYLPLLALATVSLLTILYLWRELARARRALTTHCADTFDEGAAAAAPARKAAAGAGKRAGAGRARHSAVGQRPSDVGQRPSAHDSETLQRGGGDADEEIEVDDEEIEADEAPPRRKAAAGARAAAR